MANSFTWTFCFLVVIFIQGALGYRCRTGYGSWDYTNCEYECCGSYYSEYCCGYTNITGIVVGCVIGGLVLVGVVVTVCICYQKHRAAPGVVVSPSGHNTGPTVIMATSHTGGGGYGYGPGSQYPPGQYQQGPSQGFQGNQAAPPPYPGNVGAAYPGTTGDKTPY